MHPDTAMRLTQYHRDELTECARLARAAVGGRAEAAPTCPALARHLVPGHPRRGGRLRPAEPLVGHHHFRHPRRLILKPGHSRLPRMRLSAR